MWLRGGGIGPCFAGTELQQLTREQGQRERGGPLYTFTTTTNRVERSTTFDDGRIHGIIVETGTFVAVPREDPSLPTYTGKFTNLNSFFVETAWS
jgi:hypothetical protein